MRTQPLLEARGWRTCFIHGDLSPKDRTTTIKDFKSIMGPSILLMTLGTGAVGQVLSSVQMKSMCCKANCHDRLNLGCASRIFLLETQWNPATETQAIGRAVRLGEENHVKVTRYIVKDSIEDVSNNT